jgi:biopolymer transport protein ExbD
MDIRSRNKINPAFNMSSMTDLVFLLLIFFIILSTLVNPYGVKVDLPQGKVRTKTKSNVSVSITPDLNYFVGNKSVQESELETVLMQEFGAKIEGEKQNIILYVDQTVPTGNTVKVISLAKKNEWGIVLSTKP